MPNIEKWHGYFLQVAELVSTRSRDNSTKVGAVIVNPKNMSIVSTGYNDFPAGIDDSQLWRRERPDKYEWTEHAERNAIYLAARNGHSVDGCYMYTNARGWPCLNCARAIIQSGIRLVIVPEGMWQGSDKYVEEIAKAGKMLSEAGIPVFKRKMDYD